MSTHLADERFEIGVPTFVELYREQDTGTFQYDLHQQ
jgi:hypothetical protein